MNADGRKNSILSSVRVGLDLRRITVCALGALLLAALLIALSAVFTLGVNVTVNGEKLGTLGSMKQAENVVSQVEQQVGEVLGRDFVLEGVELSRTLTLRENVSNGAAVRSELMNGISEVTNLYALSVDGEIVGAAPSCDILQQIVDEYAGDYAVGEYGFSKDVSIYYTMVPSATEQRVTKIDRALKDSVFVVTHGVEEHRESIPYSMTLIEDSTMYRGETRVVSAGVEGVLYYSQDVTYYNGVSMDREMNEEYIVSEPVDEVVAMGTMERPETKSWGSMIWPAEGILTSGFGPRARDNHPGIDIAARQGSDIMAADGGVVYYAGSKYSGYGNLVIIEHDDGSRTYYAHCSELLVEEGDEVFRGQVIAYMGSTGLATGSHLHFEVRSPDGTICDPMNSLPAR